MENRDAEPMQRILQYLVRKPASQKELTQVIELSKSRINYYISNLIDLEIVQVLSLPEQEKQEKLLSFGLNSQHKSQKLLHIASTCAYCIRVIHAEDEFVLDLFTLGQSESDFESLLKDDATGIYKRQPLTTVIVEEQNLRSSSAVECVEHTAAAVEYALAEQGICLSQVKLLLFATKGTLEQGCNGKIYRNNVLLIQPEHPINLAAMLTKACGITTYVCNYAFGHLLGIYNTLTSKQKQASAIALMCGSGSVALGIILEGRLLFGPENTFLECSHFPYLYGFEQSLGNYGPHTADALYYAIRILSPIFGINHIIVAGPTFSNCPKTISEVQQRFATDTEPQLRRIKIDYQERSIQHHRNELTLFACEQCCTLLNLHPILRDLASFAETLHQFVSLAYSTNLSSDECV